VSHVKPPMHIQISLNLSSLISNKYEPPPPPPPSSMLQPNKMWPALAPISSVTLSNLPSQGCRPAWCHPQHNIASSGCLLRHEHTCTSVLCMGAIIFMRVRTCLHSQPVNECLGRGCRVLQPCSPWPTCHPPINSYILAKDAVSECAGECTPSIFPVWNPTPLPETQKQRSPCMPRPAPVLCSGACGIFQSQVMVLLAIAGR